jgi:ubiquitin carboxyl-terminal hydrolase 4/11
VASGWSQRFSGVQAVVNHASLSKEAAKDEGLTLYKSFERFNDEEQLGEMDMWYCSKCKEHRRAYKRMGLWLLPEILIVHLKRFQYSQGVYFTHREKIEELVEFPIEGLDLSPYTLKPQDIPPIYDLYAVSVSEGPLRWKFHCPLTCFGGQNHSGGLGGGHYTAYARNFMNGRWYDFNDSSVTPLGDVRRVVSPQAYVLFYRRRKPGSDGVSTMPPADESHSEDARSDEPEAAAFSGVSAGAGQY